MAFPPTTTLLMDAGAEPRSVLRPTFPTDGEQEVALTTRSEIYQQRNDDAGEGDFSTPEVTLPLTASLEAAEEAGGAVIALEIDAPSTTEQRLQLALDDAQGMGAAMTVSPQGVITALQLRPTAQAPDIARSAIEQALYQAVYSSVSFPSEPVGLGASWTVEQSIESATELRQTTTFTLTAREGDDLTIAVQVQQRPNAQVWQLSDTDALAIDTYDVSGTGTLTVNLAQPLPVAGTVDISGTQSYSDPDSDFAITQRTVTNVRWEGS